MPPPQILKLQYLPGNGRGQGNFSTDNKPSPLLQVCKNSRAEVLKICKVSVFIRGSHRRISIDGVNDTVIIWWQLSDKARRRRNGESEEARFERYLSAENSLLSSLHGIKNLILDSIVSNHHTIKVLSHIGSVKTFSIAIPGRDILNSMNKLNVTAIHPPHWTSGRATSNYMSQIRFEALMIGYTNRARRLEDRLRQLAAELDLRVSIPQ